MRTAVGGVALAKTRSDRASRAASTYLEDQLSSEMA